jgi:hypothetical protein
MPNPNAEAGNVARDSELRALIEDRWIENVSDTSIDP